MTDKTRKLTKDGAIVISREGELIVRNSAAAWRGINERLARYAVPPEKRLPLFVDLTEHFCRLTAGQTAALRAQLHVPGGRTMKYAEGSDRGIERLQPLDPNTLRYFVRKGRT
jgi:hypothetical protein